MLDRILNVVAQKYRSFVERFESGMRETADAEDPFIIEAWPDEEREETA